MEPSLASRRDDLRRIVQALVSQKPANTFDKAFARRLRRQLMQADKPSLSFIQSFMNVFHSARLTYGLSGALVALVFMLPVMYLAATPARFTGDTSTPRILSSLTNTPVFSPQTSNAFGSLAMLAEASRSQSGGGGGGGNIPIDKVPSELSVDRLWYQPYTFVYKGETITVSDSALDVHKRIKRMSGSNIPGLSGLGGGMINVGSFTNPEVRSIDIYENTGKGYSIGINFFEGTVYINPNYETWFAEQNAACARGNCPAPMNLGEVLSDSEMISIATAFLSQHGVNTASYGNPRVDNQWRVAYDQATDKSLAYIPETISVVFPLLLQGEEVVDSGGMTYGLRVDIHQRERAVFSVWNLNTQQYESSSYPTEQDASRIVKVAERGGMYGWYGEGNPEAKQISLGTPTQVLMQFVHYNNGINEELYVPALAFPVMDAPADYYGQRTVVVPMIKEVLDSYEQNVIMPLGLGGGVMLKEAASSAIDPVIVPTPIPTEIKQ